MKFDQYNAYNKFNPRDAVEKFNPYNADAATHRRLHFLY